MALVLVVLGLLVAGLVKGQELVQNGRVHSALAEHDGYKVAVFAFHDRFRQLPGDYAEAVTNVRYARYNGNGNGKVEALATTNGPDGVREENVLAWDHLAKAGFVQGAFTFNPAIPEGAVPKNAFGGFLDLTFDSVYGDPGQSGVPRHTLKTGNQMPVEILAEMDRKIDDGNAFAGEFRFSAFARSGFAPDAGGGAGTCSSANGQWITNTALLAVNCGAAALL
jgi:hypothetical protein